MVLLEYCRACKLCCNGETGYEFELFLSPAEEKALRKAGYEFETEEVVGGFVVSYGRDNCPFLDDSSGCKLSKKLKPLDCTIFPLIFKFRNSRLGLYMSGECPYFSKLTKEEIDQSVKELEKGLESWSDDSKRAYTRRIETTKNSEIKLEDVLDGM